MIVGLCRGTQVDQANLKGLFARQVEQAQRTFIASDNSTAIRIKDYDCFGQMVQQGTDLLVELL